MKGMKELRNQLKGIQEYYNEEVKLKEKEKRIRRSYSGLTEDILDSINEDILVMETQAMEVERVIGLIERDYLIPDKCGSAIDELI